LALEHLITKTYELIRLEVRWNSHDKTQLHSCGGQTYCIFVIFVSSFHSDAIAIG